MGQTKIGTWVKNVSAATPTPTWSAHWLAHPEFSHAVEEFLQREAGGVDQYIDELNDSSPFKRAT